MEVDSCLLPLFFLVIMTKEEYFGGWMTVLPIKEMQEAISKVSPIRDKICPDYKNIFISRAYFISNRTNSTNYFLHFFSWENI